MPQPLPDSVRGISFDFANTLYPLNRAETAATIRHLHAFLELRLNRPLPGDTLHELYLEIRERQFAENKATLRENDFPARLREMITRVDEPPSDALVSEAVEAYADGFIEEMKLPDGTYEGVRELSARYDGRIAVCSNFIVARAITEPLRRDGLLPLMKGAVISCDVGFVKPHPLVFETVAKMLDLAPHQIAHVGDDLEADIYGGRRAGMTTVLTTQLCEAIDTQRIEEARPDVTIDRLSLLV